MYKSVILAVSALAGLTYAQVPACGQSCIAPPAECNLVDVSCICNSQEWIQGVACCVFANCDESDRSSALAYGNTVCGAVSVTLPTTTSNCPASSSGSSSGSSSPASASASTTGSDSSSATGVAASASSRSSALSSALESVSTSGSAAVTSAAMATRAAVADGVGIVGALIGVAALL